MGRCEDVKLMSGVNGGPEELTLKANVFHFHSRFVKNSDCCYFSVPEVCD